MNITYFHRNQKAGFSIGRVFKTITNEISKKNSINEFYVPSHRSLPLDIFKNLYFVYKHRNKIGVNHISGDISYCVLALVGCKSVITIHDLVVLENGNFIKRFIKGFFWIYLPVKFANKITCISKETESRLLNYVNTKKTLVIHNAVDPSFQYNKKTKVNRELIILHIGTGWNKNLANVIDSLCGLPCQIRIIGKLNEIQKEKLSKTNISYSSVVGISDEEIIKEYIECDIVSFPSIYEGFGMPIIEGQKIGRPVLTSRLEPLIEIGKDSVTFVDPYDTSSMRKGFSELILNMSYRESMVERGLENVKRFSVEKIVSNYMDLYIEVKNHINN